MEIYNFNPDDGVYLGVSVADPDPLSDGEYLIPAFATILRPPEEREGFVWRFVDGAWGYSPEGEYETPPAEEPVVSAAMVSSELDRRLALGFDYSFGDERGTHHLGTTPTDMKRWTEEVTPLSQAYLNMGQPDGQIGIKTETGPVAVTATEWQQILLAAGVHRQPIYQAYFALKDMAPIPADYASARYWP
ncbi:MULTISPECIES: hypothetical protein [unclassified Agrobacterium]|uniref:DUF4376 domain-containing protein n=1 Tax=unclassified Agrobacterium TaxID=2632611 RepID=UPI0022BD6E0A|nr:MULTISPECIES: hypothetical protein [unclassified Agrobacterium]MCZ7499380.1 hypothetical protein [Rhizobium rhizogenes]MDH0613657.1 hypothetical protein [Agrobacterium sp. GD03872]MDH0696546.1 hypothetical protein [Agrobacterium sp. GD03871]MDH1059858.1 hypothetical protein [Agrobacterium sp. GD03992]MDH2210205.1 hypothetical protein [Agrobacterium sp. GD03643]